MTGAIAVTSPLDIEVAIETYLVSRIDVFKKSARQQNMRFIFTDPAVVVWIADGKLEKEGQRSFRVTCPVHVEISMKNSRSVEARRDGVNPLVFGVIRTLTRQRFGLKITDLMPRGFREVTADEDYINDQIVYDLEFSTSFNIEVSGDDDTEDLLNVGLSYFLEPDDGNVDVSDTVNFAP